MEVKEILKDNLINLRKKHDFTQSDLAKKVNFSDKAISRWENGEVVPEVETLAKLSKIYNVDITYFFEKHSKEEHSEQKLDTQFINKIVLTLVTVFVVWLIATIAFVYLKLLENIIFWQIFVWAVPISCIVGLFANLYWFKSKDFKLVLESIIIWALITSFYLTFLSYNLWLIYLIGIPSQATVIARYFLK